MRTLRLIRLARLGIKDLTLHKLRSLLTTLGVVFGVASVIAMLAVGEGASRQALDQIRKLGSHTIIISSVKPVEDEQTPITRRTPLLVYGLLLDDEARIREGIRTVSRIVPVRLVRRDASIGTRKMELRAVGTTPGWFRLVQRPLLAGRVIEERDLAQRAPVCVLTEHGARRLLAGEAPLGAQIRIGGTYFEVIGVIRNEEGGTGVQMPDQETDAYMPIDASVERYGNMIVEMATGSFSAEQVELHQLLVEVRSTEDVEPAAKAITAMLRQHHPKEDYKVHVPLTLLRQAQATRRTFNIVLGSIAGISLLVGGIGIMNIMLASVTERTREIGIRRAIGARRSHIIVQFLVETVVLSVSGGIIGIGVGTLIPWAITRLSGMPTVVPLYGLILSFGISVSIGLLFGLYPAFRAARLDPIEALRHE